MRDLLVLTHSQLPADVRQSLEGHAWRPRMIADAAGAAGTTHGATSEPPLVGLVMLPQTQDLDSARPLLEQVRNLAGIKWVAALAEGHLEHQEIKRFIAEQLYDFHVFPLQAERLATVLGHAYGMASIERELNLTTADDTHRRFGLIGESPVMLSLYRMLQRAAESDVSVLITGPTGTGKELAARAIHDHSDRARGPYVAINCAAIPPSLLQSELFGHEKGSFTSAHGRKTGYIQSAAGGTLFLDEIGDMPLESQATLLRFLEDKIVTPIGSTRGKQVDVRVIASTNVDLHQAILDKSFRADLYYRLAFLTIETPSLRSRGNDIELLARHFLEEVIAEAGMRNLSLAEDAVQRLRDHDWPGNVRELRSTIFQAALSCDTTQIRERHLKLRQSSRRLEPPPAPEAGDKHYGRSAGHYITSTLKSAREQSEKRNLEYALQRNASNVTRAAQELGISRMTLYRLMAKHGVARS